MIFYKNIFKVIITLLILAQLNCNYDKNRKCYTIKLYLYCFVIYFLYKLKYDKKDAFNIEVIFFGKCYL